jgi:dipeptidyl aminopeptidase/acylaminoacyl peptidase
MPAKPYSQNDVFLARHIFDGVMSPSGDVIVAAVSETLPGVEPGSESQRSTLWRVGTNGGEPRRITSERASSASPRFAPDGRLLYFLSARDADGKDNQVHRLPMGGGEATVVTSLPGGVTAFAMSPDGTRLACVSTGVTAKARGPGDHVRIARTVFRYDPLAGYLQDCAQSIHVVSLLGGGVARLTDPDGLISSLTWAPDSRHIAFVRQMGLASDLFGHGDLGVVAPGEPERILVGRAMLQAPFWTADGAHVGYCSPADGDVARQSQLWVVPAAGGTPMQRTSRIDRPIPGLFQVNSPAVRTAGAAFAVGDAAITTMADGGHGRLVRVGLSGAERIDTLLSGERIARLLDVRHGRMLYTEQGFNTPTTLHLADIDGSAARQLVDLNAEWRGSVRWPAIEHVEATSEDGTPIEAWVLLPPEARLPCKALLYIHGGPHSAWGCGYSEDVHELVGSGYAVILVNPRGSVGYGDEFATAIAGRWGEAEHQDFDAVLDLLVRRGLIQGERTGVMGVSGGGHLAAWLITHTDRFVAAVPEQGVYNMISMYGVSDCGPVLVDRELGGKPHELPELYWRLSPVAHAHRCRTPTLLIQGEDDIRCPMQQAEEFYTALRVAGCTVELLRLSHCKHGTQMAGPPALRRFRMNAIKDWFDRHMPEQMNDPP